MCDNDSFVLFGCNEVLTHLLILPKINSLKDRLIQLGEVMDEISTSTEDSELVPSPDKIDVFKQLIGALLTTDTCNAAQKLRRVIIEDIPGALQFDVCIIYAMFGSATWRNS